jgi:hypothetical protein
MPTMNFITYIALLVLGGILALLIFSFSFAPLLLLLVFAKSQTPPPKILTFLLSALAALCLIYLSGAWAAYCVALAYKYTNTPEVIWDWLYFIVGFVWCLVIARVWAKWTVEGIVRGEQPPRQLRLIISVLKSSIFHIAYIGQLPALLAYIGFAIYQNLMRVPYGWLLTALD